MRARRKEGREGKEQEGKDKKKAGGRSEQASQIKAPSSGVPTVAQ